MILEITIHEEKVESALARLRAAGHLNVSREELGVFLADFTTAILTAPSLGTAFDVFLKFNTLQTEFPGRKE